MDLVTFRNPLSLDKIQRRNPQINWTAIRAFRAELAADYKKARRSIQLLLPAEVLMRFAAPSKVGETKAHLYWTYCRRRFPSDPKSEGSGWLTVYFKDGLVIEIEQHFR